MRPRLVVDNEKNGQVVKLFESIPIEEEKPRLYMDYGMAKFLIWLFFFAGFFVGTVMMTIIWIFSGT